MNESKFKHIGKPTIAPKTLDEAFRLIETGEGNWVFKQEIPEDAEYLLTWKHIKDIYAKSIDDKGKSLLLISAKNLSEIIAPIEFPKIGIVSIPEKVIFYLVMLEVARGNILMGKPEGDKAGFYGEGVKNIFDAIAKDYLD